MPIHAVTLQLPDEIYQQAQRVARATRRPIEKVVCEWIRPPAAEIQLPELDHLSNDELLQAAGETVPAEHTHRLQELLNAQRQRTLSEDEQREAVTLVEQEDTLTLRKARALLLLKQRGIPPADLALDS